MNDSVTYVNPKHLIGHPKYPFLTKGRINHYLLHRHKNGLAKAVRKIGNKCLVIRLDLFDKWIEDQSSKGGK